MKRIRMPGPAMIVACIGVVVGLTGTAFALGQNSVGARELAPVVQRTGTAHIDPKNTAFGQAKAHCKKGEQLLGGGATIDNAGSSGLESEIRESGPSGKRGWYARAFSNEPVVRTLKVTALCLTN